MPELTDLQEIILARLKLGPYRADRLAKSAETTGAKLMEGLHDLVTAQLVEVYHVHGRNWVRATAILPPAEDDTPFIPRSLLKA